MEKTEEKLFTIGELASKVGVTVRTLQYYDKTGLLKSGFSNSGRRMYNRNDILQLQQILFLKSFGFSLEEIRDRLLSSESKVQLESLFNQQKNILLGQIANLQEIVKMTDMVIAEIRVGGEVSIEKLMAIMELMKQGNPYSFIVRYFSRGQLESVAKRFDSPTQVEKFQHKSEAIFAQMYKLYQQSADPAGKDGQELAAKWWNMVNEFTAGDSNLLATLISAGRDIDNWPDEVKEMQQAIKNFLEQALDVYFKNNGIKVPGKDAKKNE